MAWNQVPFKLCTILYKMLLWVTILKFYKHNTFMCTKKLGYLDWNWMCGSYSSSTLGCEGIIHSKHIYKFDKFINDWLEAIGIECVIAIES